MNFYAKTPGRALAQNASHSNPPPELKFEDAPLPIDDSDEGCDMPGDKPHDAFTREISTLTVCRLKRRFSAFINDNARTIATLSAKTEKLPAITAV